MGKQRPAKAQELLKVTQLFHYQVALPCTDHAALSHPHLTYTAPSHPLPSMLPLTAPMLLICEVPAQVTSTRKSSSTHLPHSSAATGVPRGPRTCRYPWRGLFLFPLPMVGASLKGRYWGAQDPVPTHGLEHPYSPAPSGQPGWMALAIPLTSALSFSYYFFSH